MIAGVAKGPRGTDPVPRGRRKRRQRDPVALAAAALIWLFFGLFILFPLVHLLQYTFVQDGSFTLAGINKVLASRGNRRAFVNSLTLGTLVGVAATGLGFLFAFAHSRANLPRFWRWFLDAIIVLPLISPPFTSALSFLFSFGPRGVLTYHLLGIEGSSIYGMWSTMVAETLTYFPLAYMTLRGVLANIDTSIQDAAFSLGSSRWHVFRTVTLPLSVPGIANAFLLMFSASLADFATPLVLAGHKFPVLPTQAYLQITGLFDLRGGAVLSFILLIPSLIVFALQRYWVERKSYVTVTGKSSSGTASRLVGRWAKYGLLSICLAVAAFILFLYGMILFGSLVKVWGADHTFTLRNYEYLLKHGRKSISDTLKIAFMVMPIGGVLGIVVGYLVTRKWLPGRRLLEFVSMLNYAMPGTVVGIAYLLAFNDKPIMLAGTATILVAAYVFRYSPTGIRATIAALQQIDPSIEEASASLGAGTFTTLRKVTVPLVLPALFTGLETTFIRAMTAISATIFLVSVNWTLITVRILESATELELGHAAAFSIFVIVVVYAVINLLRFGLRLTGLQELQAKTDAF